jgi:hypothetical protein
VCQITVKLIKAATKGWAPTTHWLHHVGVRTAVHTMLLVGERLQKQTVVPAGRRGRSAIVNATGAVLPAIPPEMWMAVIRFFVRRDLSATAVVAVR